MHEHLDEMGLVHMNGRIYDPLIGRFMSADPFLQAPGNLQSHNRYSYVMNNPLNLTDPSGFSWWTRFRDKILKPVVFAYIGYLTGGLISNALITGASTGFAVGANGLSTAFVTLGGSAGSLTTLGGVLAGAGGGFVAGALSSGTLDGGLRGAFTGGVFGGIGASGAANGWGTGQYVAAHAAGGCITSVAGGGACGSGAASAAFGKFTTIAIGDVQGDFAKGVASTVAGGVGSVIAGGKFENGAVTAAYGYLFNNCINSPGGCRAFAEKVFNKFIGAISPPVPVGVTAEASTFVVDYNLSVDTSGRVYAGGGRSIIPGETPGGSLKIHFTNRAWTPEQKYDFFDGASYSLTVSGAGVTAGRSYSPAGPTTFFKTTDIGISTQQGVGLSTGLSTCIANCPKN
jgi:RHS repeat-associated protein